MFSGEWNLTKEIKFGLENLGKHIQYNNLESFDVGKRIILRWVLEK
jgi:hypothetical protein